MLLIGSRQGSRDLVSMDIVAVFRALSGIVLQKPTCRSYLLSSMILYVGFNEAGPKLEGAWDLQSCLLRNMAFSSSSPSLEGLRESHNFTHLSYPACRAEEPGLPMLFNVFTFALNPLNTKP